MSLGFPAIKDDIHQAAAVFFAFAFSILVVPTEQAGKSRSFDSVNAGGQTHPIDTDFGIVTPTVGGSGNNWHLTLRIEQPNVKQHITNYTGVGFEPGDRVTISAGGCVQTGGAGKTWKRYVDPQGPNSDRLYYGVVWIPGITGGPPNRNAPQPTKRLQEVINRTFVLPTPNDTSN